MIKFMQLCSKILKYCVLSFYLIIRYFIIISYNIIHYNIIFDKMYKSRTLALLKNCQGPKNEGGHFSTSNSKSYTVPTYSVNFIILTKNIMYLPIQTLILIL